MKKGLGSSLKAVQFLPKWVWECKCSYFVQHNPSRRKEARMAPQVDDVEKQPLLQDATATLPVPEKQPRTWRGHWSQLFGPSFEAHDTAACCLAWHAPPVAWG